MKKILYVEDMEECYKKTNKVLGNFFEIDWRKNYSEAIDAINKNLDKYSVAIFDINLDYEPYLSNDEQTKEGVSLIKIIKKELKNKGISIPIICASSNGKLYRELSLKAGADVFLWKKEFWEKGKIVLDNLIKKV